MNLKIFTQISLAVIAIIISFVFYHKYFDTKNSKNIKKNLEFTDKKIKGNIIKDIEYKSQDVKGNLYIINSELGEFSEDDQNLIYMTNVKAVLKFTNGNLVNLSSDKARYNTISNDTNFFENVAMDYLDHKITADNLDIYFKNGELEAYNNLVYRNLELNLIADKVKVDLITKDSKIFMLDNKKKVKVFNNK